MITKHNTEFTLSTTDKVFESPEDDMSAFIRYCLASCDIHMNREVSPLERFIITDILIEFYDFYIPLHRNYLEMDRKVFVNYNYINLDNMRKYDGEDLDDVSESFSYFSNLMREIIETESDFDKLKIFDKTMMANKDSSFTDGYHEIINKKTMMVSAQDTLDDEVSDFHFSDFDNIGIIQNSDGDTLYISDFLIGEMSLDADDHPIGILTIR